MIDPDIVACGSPEELLGALAPRSKWFVDAAPHAWVFRGHASEDWGLVPSAFRPDPSLADSKFPPQRAWVDWTNADQIQAEAETLQQFMTEADGAGLPIPQESHELRERVGEPFKHWYGLKFESRQLEWPPRVAWPVVALAQHYGLATRFLDWTYSSYIAAYFAAVGAVKSQTQESLLTIWAFSVAARTACWGVLSPFGKLPERFPEVVHAPYAGNPNLRAQEGLHIAVRTTGSKWHERVERLDYLTYLKYVDEFSCGVGSKALYKFTLPARHAPELLWHLAKERVTAARLFPGYGGAAQSVLEQRLSRTSSKK